MQSYAGDFISHHGILGMRWGIRRFQRKDGTLTPAGKKRDREQRKDDDDSFTLKKGTNTYRFANKDDPNDWISNMAEMPIIMFDPKEKNKRTGYIDYKP